jgi:hypothetical protein
MHAQAWLLRARHGICSTNFGITLNGRHLCVPATAGVRPAQVCIVSRAVMIRWSCAIVAVRSIQDTTSRIRPNRRRSGYFGRFVDAPYLT